MEISFPKPLHGKGTTPGYNNFLGSKKDVWIKYGGNIPHWERQGIMQFITFRLADSLPKSALIDYKQQIEEWEKNHPKPWSLSEYEEYSELGDTVDSVLNKNLGECVLKYKAVQDIIIDALDYFDGDRYDLFDFIIMPNHVHLLLIPGTEFQVEEILHSIKSFTANKINKILGREGTLWQKESFDHMVRNHVKFEEYQEYIKNNWKPK